MPEVKHSRRNVPTTEKLAILSKVAYHYSMSSETATHYVDNEKFQAAMLERRILVDQCKAEGRDKPKVSDYIGECIYKIATHLAYKDNFIGYSYRDEMIGDGIENCLRYLDNYDPYKYAKPFAYFTQVNWYAFIRRINREKKQSAVKARLIREIPFEVFNLQDHDESGDFTNAFVEYLQQHDTMDTSAYDSPKKKGRKKKTAEPDLSDFIEEPLVDVEAVPTEFELPDDILADEESDE
jgi:hypothetical protein